MADQRTDRARADGYSNAGSNAGLSGVTTRFIYARVVLCLRCRREAYVLLVLFIAWQRALSANLPT